MTRSAPTLEFTPYNEQRDVLQSDARFRVVAAGRRSGKTMLAAVETIRRAIEHGDGWHAYWVGAEHTHADTAFKLIDGAVPEQFIARRNRSPPRIHEFDNGAEITYQTAGGGANVSVGLDWVVCDEAAKDFPEHVWTGELRPTLSDRDGDAMFISTPDGKGWFYRAFQRGQSTDSPAWASWRWPTYRNPHVDDAEVDSARNEIPERVFEQEYLAKFKDETGGVFEGLGETLFVGEYDLPVAPADATPPFSIGVDIARHQDYRVIVVLDADGRLVAFDREQGEAWPQIQNAVQTYATRYDGLVSIDASRDNKLVADLERAGLDIRPVTFSSSRKQDLIENLVASVEAGDLEAPAWDTHPLRQEMEVFEFDVTRAGNVRYDAPQGFHDDTIDSLALACDGLAHVARQGASGTITMGGDEPDDDGRGVEAAAKKALRERQQARKGWK